jgi:hypothetical protein
MVCHLQVFFYLRLPEIPKELQGWQHLSFSNFMKFEPKKGDKISLDYA